MKRSMKPNQANTHLPAPTCKSITLHHLHLPINQLSPTQSLLITSLTIFSFFISKDIATTMIIFLIYFIVLSINPHIAISTSSSNNNPNSLKLPLRRINPSFSTSFASSHRSGHHPIKSPIVSGASTGSGQYFVEIRLGMPPQRLRLVADTGSDLVWVSSSPCLTNCSSSSSHHHRSLFFPRNSSTFSPSHCFSPSCTRLVPRSPTRHRNCSRTRLHSPCWFDYSYSDGSSASGIFASDAASFRRSTKTLDLDFGCGFEVSGPSLTGRSFNGANGVLGLGRGPISFTSQLGRRFGNRFSYCLLDYTLAPPRTSFLLIGGGTGQRRVDRFNLSSTPLLTNPLSPTFYYVSIKSAFVDHSELPIDPSVWALDGSGNGGTIIDTGTTLSSFPEPAYRAMLSEIRKKLLIPVLDDPTPGFDLCVNVTGKGDSGSPSLLPRMRLVFDSGAVFAPPTGNYFIETEEGVRCFAVQAVGSPVGFGVIGNLMQQGFLFEFDIDRGRVRFSGDQRACAVH